MPKESGRSGKPGNQRTMRRIDIHTAHPELLQPGASRPQKTYSEVVNKKKKNSVKFQKGKYNYATQRVKGY